MRWVCEEKLAAVAMGCVGLATLDPDKVVGGAVAGAGLLKLWGAAREQNGVGSEALLARVRKRVGKGFADWAAGHPGAEADILAADKAMAKHLADCVPPVAELAKTTYDEEDFPAYAARLIVERLATRNAIFSETSDIRVPAAREFALAVVTGALTEAKSVEPFMVRLTQEVVLLIPQHLQRIERTVEAGFAAQDAQFAELKAMLSSQLGIPIEVLGREIAAILELNPATSQAELYDDLRDYKRKHDDLAAQLDAVLVIDNRIAALKADAEAALAAYDHDAADRIFGEMRAVEDERIAEGMRRSADYANGQAQARMLKRDWQGAADVWMEAARKLAVFEPEAAGYLHNTAGIALNEFGEKFAGAATNAAIAAFRAALKIITRDALPAQWAGMHNNLGAALRVQGERSGGGIGLALLAEAVAAYRAALGVFTRDALPADWAMTQNNLGNALQAQGERSDGDVGLALLAEAVSAYRAALEVVTRGGLPVQWATIQNNLGNTLRVQGARSDGAAGIALLAEAVAACRAALEVRTRDALPADWAMTQNNLGNALQVQGARSGGETGIAFLAEAVAAYRAALEVRTREGLPALWAATQGNIAAAFANLAEADPSNRCVHYRTAREAVSLALEVFTPEHMPYDHGKAANLLAYFEAAIAEHCPDASASS
jgi:tetratricopeptide (TPR) repeat protein